MRVVLVALFVLTLLVGMLRVEAIFFDEVHDANEFFDNFDFTYEELLAYYRAVSRRWYEPATFRLFYGAYNMVFGHHFFVHYRALFENVTETLYEADIIGGVVYLYPPRGLVFYTIAGYPNVYVVHGNAVYPWKINIPWAVNVLYDYIGVLPRAIEGEWNYDSPHIHGILYYTLLAPDYYLLEYDSPCVLPNNSKYFVVNSVDVLKYYCSKPSWLNISPQVIVVPELYEELRSKHGVYPIYIWINDKIRYVGILAGIETTIGGAIRPDIHNLIRKHTGLNITRDYVVFVVVAPIFASKGVSSITTRYNGYFGEYLLCSRNGCIQTGFCVDVYGYRHIALVFSFSNGWFRYLNEELRKTFGSDFPIYYSVRIEGVIYTSYYVYEPRIVVPEGVYHVKPNYTYLLFPYFVRDLRAGNLTLPPPNTERVFLNETDIPDDYDFIFSPPTGGSAPTFTPTPTTTTAPPITTTTQPTSETPVPTTTLVSPIPTTTTPSPTTTTPTETMPPLTITIPVPTTVVVKEPVCDPECVSPFIIALAVAIGFAIGFVVARGSRKK